MLLSGAGGLQVKHNIFLVYAALVWASRHKSCSCWQATGVALPWWCHNLAKHSLACHRRAALLPLSPGSSLLHMCWRTSVAHWQRRLAQAARYQRHSCGAAVRLTAEVLTALHETGALQRSPALAHAVEAQLQELADVLASFSARWLIRWFSRPCLLLHGSDITSRR